MAYRNGRADTDPSEGWYQGEIDFFDFYIIPLAKKLKECGVFGVASDEYLDYAIANRNEWEVKGKDIVQEYRADYQARQEAADSAASTEGTPKQTNQSRKVSEKATAFSSPVGLLKPEPSTANTKNKKSLSGVPTRTLLRQPSLSFKRQPSMPSLSVRGMK